MALSFVNLRSYAMIDYILSKKMVIMTVQVTVAKKEIKTWTENRN
jgi:hypothetical protein